MELVRGKHKSGLIGPVGKEIPKEVVDSLDWESYPTQPGDIIFFDSYVPHRSGPNKTNAPRRVLYATYNKLSEGDARLQYYDD